MPISIRGSSDDAIIIEGNGFKEQFDCYESEAVVRFLAFSDGTLLRITYGISNEACWRITRLRPGSSQYSLQQVTTHNSAGEYSDVATLSESEPIQWVTCAKTPPAYRQNKKVEPAPL